MFSPRVIEAQETALQDTLKGHIPGGRFVRRPIDVCWAMRDRLASAVDAKGKPLRDLTAEETVFLAHERILTAIDFRYWAERYAVIAKDTQDAAPITPFWVSQDLFLRHLARLEESRHDEGHPDGLLVNVLKARQLGISTITEVILAHAVTTQPSVRGLVAADVETQSRYMFSMAEMVIQNLPWWLLPPLGSPTTRGTQVTFNATHSTLMAFWGKSARGGLADREKAKGNLGRGKTFNRIHLSELSTWERPEQIDDGLMPGVPVRRRTFAVLESTAKGRYDWWHRHWDQADRGVGRFANIFIPWYIEPDKYWLPAPAGWTPAPTTQQHIEEVLQDSARWTLGMTVRLTREQAYWYEHTRRTYDDEEAGAEFTADGRRVATFYEEYPASPRDAFQHAGKSIFTTKQLERFRAREIPPRAICVVEPAKDIAQLKAWERSQATQAGVSA